MDRVVPAGKRTRRHLLNSPETRTSRRNSLRSLEFLTGALSVSHEHTHTGARSNRRKKTEGMRGGYGCRGQSLVPSLSSLQQRGFQTSRRSLDTHDEACLAWTMNNRGGEMEDGAKMEENGSVVTVAFISTDVGAASRNQTRKAALGLPHNPSWYYLRFWQL